MLDFVYELEEEERGNVLCWMKWMRLKVDGNENELNGGIEIERWGVKWKVRDRALLEEGAQIGSRCCSLLLELSIVGDCRR